MNIKQSLINMFTNAKNSLNDKVIPEEIEDIRNIAADADYRQGILKDAISLVDHCKFASIRKYLSLGLNEEKSINQLAEYVKAPDRAYFVLSYVRKAVLLDSILATSLMAFIVFKISGENRKARHEEMIILNALCSLTDYDMKNMFYLCKHCIVKRKNDPSAEGKFNLEALDGEKQSSCEITLNLLTSYGVVQKDPTSLDMGEIGETFESVDVSQAVTDGVDGTLNLNGDYKPTAVTKLFYDYMRGMSQLYRDALHYE